jgi:hypothetical protein
MKSPSKFSALLAWILPALMMMLAMPGAFATDLSITATSVTPSVNAVIRDGVAGAAITAGKLLYKDATASYVLKLADGDSATAGVRVVCGIAINSAAAGARVNYVVSDPALSIGATVANGTVYVLSVTPGGIAPLADLTSTWYPFVVALGTSTTTVAFRADLVNPLRSTTVMP